MLFFFLLILFFFCSSCFCSSYITERKGNQSALTVPLLCLTLSDDSNLLSFDNTDELFTLVQTKPLEPSPASQEQDPFSSLMSPTINPARRSPSPQTQPQSSSLADLIDLSPDPPPEANTSLLELSSAQLNGIRDSSYSTGSSARDSTISTGSCTRESYLEGSLDFELIPEEQSPDKTQFRKRTSRIIRPSSEVDVPRQRDSRTSVDSVEAAATGPSLSSSSSTQEEDPDTPAANPGPCVLNLACSRSRVFAFYGFILISRL